MGFEMGFEPAEILPLGITNGLSKATVWFVIGGNAVRCISPYRPTRDVDFGVGSCDDIDVLVAQLHKTGKVVNLEASKDTRHLNWNGIDVSVFMLDTLLPFVENHRLTVKGILATKLHAILDRGKRRDFFDLYVTMQEHQLGVSECISAIAEVFDQRVDETLLLRALCYFDDADVDAAIPGEGPGDWRLVKLFFMQNAACLIAPPHERLAIQSQIVDVTPRVKSSAKKTADQ